MIHRIVSGYGMNLAGKLHKYGSKHPSERVNVQACMRLLEDSPECFMRDAFPGHFTASAWTINQACDSTILVLHRKLGKWVQPGGHADGEQNLYLAARRELDEETGVAAKPCQGDDIFDVDIHCIPAAGGEGSHHHYDIRFLFFVHELSPLRVSDESRDIRWISFDDLEQYTAEQSILRMRTKCLS
jgi:8-oxo-dGTP pyrophosphatase MutT (NUDIX family)